MTDWRAEVTGAVNAWLAKVDGADKQASWRRVGRARQDAKPGWYQVDLRGAKVSEEQLDQLRLAGPRPPGRNGADGPAAPSRASNGRTQGAWTAGAWTAGGRTAADSTAAAPAETETDIETETETETEADGFSVMDAVIDGALLRFRVAEFARPEDPHLWAFQQPPTFLITSLRDGLGKLTDPGLAHNLARGELNGVPSRLSTALGRSGRSLSPRQQQVYQAALGTGLWLVWGPPGTGKTSVLCRAIADLLGAGKRVLLVSSTNIAVDNALAGVVKDLRPEPGRIVRVGPPQLAEVARNQDVSLPALVRARLARLEAQRSEVEAKLTAFRREADDLALCEKLTEDFDHAGYLAARTLAGDDPAESRAGLVAAETEAEQQIELWGRQHAGLLAKMQRAALGYAATVHSRGVWDQVEPLRRAAARIEADAAVLAGKAAEMQVEAYRRADQLARWDAQPAFTRWRTKAVGDQLRNAAAQAGYTARTVTGQAESVRLAAGVRRAEIDRDIESAAAAANHSEEEIRLLAEAERTAREEEQSAKDYHGQWLAQFADRSRAIAEHDSALEVIEKAERGGMPAYHARLMQLRRNASDSSALRTSLEKEYSVLEAEYTKDSRKATGDIIRNAGMIATTLARFRTTESVLEGKYDAVFVDEVGAASLPEVLLAVAKAGTVAVMLGDFQQLGAVGLDELDRKIKRPDFTKWVATDVFEHCGITSPAETAANPHCITLDTQHRFGLDVMELANRTSYAGMLKAGPSQLQRGPGTSDDPQIVLLDTDGLGELEQVYRQSRIGGWWLAGTLLARAVCELHADRGEDVGIVTPYRLQAEATLEALRDIERSGGVLADVGTAHRFQGREFPIVVFDMVEAPDTAGWMAKASRTEPRGSWGNSGMRLFNVATTRVQNTLYLVGSGLRIRQADRDSPLAPILDLVNSRRIQRLPASVLITPSGAIPAELGELGGRLAEILSRQAEVVAIHDDRTFFDAFLPRIEAATESIWLWAPWAKERTRQVIPALSRAVDRGVRVTVFVRGPGDQLHKDDLEPLRELQAAIPNVVPVYQMHQKIAVFDEKVTVYGSLNMLSQRSGQTLESMMTLVGGGLARMVLKEEHASAFGRPPRCGVCSRPDVELKRREPNKKGGFLRKGEGWYWRCFSSRCPTGGGNKAWKQNIEIRL
jgi:hypothetical protein